MRGFKIVAAMMRTIKRWLEACGCRKIKTREMLICGSEVQQNRERSEATSIRRESVRIFVERTRSGASKCPRRDGARVVHGFPLAVALPQYPWTVWVPADAARLRACVVLALEDEARAVRQGRQGRPKTTQGQGRRGRTRPGQRKGRPGLDWSGRFGGFVLRGDRWL